LEIKGDISLAIRQCQFWAIKMKARGCRQSEQPRVKEGPEKTWKEQQGKAGAISGLENLTKLFLMA
jgi:hypothetical protein